MSDTELCPVEPTIVYSENYTLAALGILFGFLIAVFYKFQKAIKLWLCAPHLRLSFATEDESDEEKLYDAFVSYVHHDEAFVVDHLIPRLEGDYHYRLCLHLRDWIPGESVLAQIAKSVENSRRTIIVLSTAFLKSNWGRMEFCLAHKQALSKGRLKVIVILYGDIGPTDKLDLELRTYLSMSTCIKRSEKLFWEKLDYAMPHSSKFRKEIPLQKSA